MREEEEEWVCISVCTYVEFGKLIGKAFETIGLPGGLRYIRGFEGSGVFKVVRQSHKAHHTQERRTTLPSFLFSCIHTHAQTHSYVCNLNHTFSASYISTYPNPGKT